MSKLVIEKGKDKGKALVLKASAVFLIGRDLKTDLRLRDLQASRRHLKITTRNGDSLLEDLDSSNGTYVNGKRVRSAKLGAGDKIQVGDTLIFYLEEESQDEVNQTQDVDTLAATTNRKGELTGREVTGYKVGHLLGRGGMGTVYEAIQVSLERRVAFKVLAPELAADKQFVDRFTAEARAAGALNHPNLVQVYDVGFANDVRFYSMEYMAKGSVEDLLRKHGKLPTGHALAIAFDAARGLEYAERKGIVHRDIKPDNLMVSEDDVVKIGDLGIATRKRAENDTSGEDTISGSPHYIAPEQALGKNIDNRADLYALGISLYQILCGETPYEGTSAREVILKHLNEKPPPLAPRAPTVPPEVVAIVERLMEKDPGKRPASASVLLQELVPLLRQFPVSVDAAAHLDGFLSKRLELNIQAAPTSAANPRIGSGRAAPTQSTTETGALATAPTDQNRVPSKRDLEVSRQQARSALIGVVGVLGALALGIGAFSVVHSLRVQAANARAARVKAITETRLLLEADLAKCEHDAHELELRFRAEGATDDAIVAHDLAQEAQKRLSVVESDKRKRLAESALAGTRKDVEAIETRADDPEGVVKLERAAILFEKVAKAFPGTPAGDEADKARKGSLASLERARATRGQRQAEEGDVKKAYDREAAAIKDLCANLRFDDAALLLDAFSEQQRKTDAGKKASASLTQLTRDEIEAALTIVFANVHELSKQKRYPEARDLLRPIVPKLAKFYDFHKRADSELIQVEDAALATRTNANQRLHQDDEERLRKAESDARHALAGRHFDTAATFFSTAAPSAVTPEGREALQWRADRLELAHAAVKRLIDFVKTRKEKAAIFNQFTVVGESMRYVAFDASLSTLEIRFHDERNSTLVADLSLSDAGAGNFHDWALKAVANDASGLLECAALGIELGRFDRARRDLDQANRIGSTDDAATKTAKLLAADIENHK